MGTLRRVVVSIGCLLSAFPAWGGKLDNDDFMRQENAYAANEANNAVADGSGIVERIDAYLSSAARRANGGANAPDHGISQSTAPAYSQALSLDSAVFGYIGSQAEPALGPPSPYPYWRRAESLRDSSANRWANYANAQSEVYTLGYVWRRFQVEGSAFSSREPDVVQQQSKAVYAKPDSGSGRLSFKPTGNWALQLSRGYLGYLDQLLPNEDIRRTSVSATYTHNFNNANWQTTLAYGHSKRKFRESTTGYLVESTMKLANMHAFFGRLEQVGSDDLLRENESFQRQAFKMNKLTLGYFRDVRTNGPVKYDVGGLVSRHFVPAEAVASYGSDPTNFLLFIRFKLK